MPFSLVLVGDNGLLTNLKLGVHAPLRSRLGYCIDYELYPKAIPEPVAYFHSHWRRENPCRGWAPELQVNSPEVNVPHLDAKGNYVVLETEGTGHYVGCNLSIAHFQGSWWGRRR